VIRQANLAACKIFDAERSMLVSRNFSSYLQTTSRLSFESFLGAVFEGGDKKVLEADIWCSARPKCSVRMEAMASEDKRECRVIIEDVTEQKRIEAEKERLMARLERANSNLSNFAYIVSHDLKAPLCSISNMADVLLLDTTKGNYSDVKKQLNLIQARAKRLYAMIEGILEYSKLGEVCGNPVEVDLKQLLRQLFEMVVPKKGLTLKIEDELPRVFVDKDRISQVFQNLVSNAVKFMDKPDGCVRIGCRRTNGSLRFSVADNGPGIEEKYFGKIFEIFQTLSPRDTIEGTGLGLTIVKKIVENFGGRVWVESEVGKGSTFYFTLPLEVLDMPKGGVNPTKILP